MTSYNLGQSVTLSTTVYGSDAAAEDATVALTVTDPSGTETTPDVTHDGVSGSGQYEATFTVDSVGTWWWRWDATGTVLANDRGQFTVGDPKPATYASLVEFKGWLKGAYNSTDAELLARLSASARRIDNDCGRRFWLDTTATARVFDTHQRVVDDGQRLLVDDIGSAAGMVVEVGDKVTDTWTTVTDYTTGPDNALARGKPVTWLKRSRRSGGWCHPHARITGRWGWPLIPDDIHDANLIQAARLHSRASSPIGVAGFDEAGVVRVGRSDPDYAALIAAYVLGDQG